MVALSCVRKWRLVSTLSTLVKSYEQQSSTRTKSLRLPRCSWPSKTTCSGTAVNHTDVINYTRSPSVALETTKIGRGLRTVSLFTSLHNLVQFLFIALVIHHHLIVEGDLLVSKTPPILWSLIIVAIFNELWWDFEQSQLLWSLNIESRCKLTCKNVMVDIVDVSLGPEGISEGYVEIWACASCRMSKGHSGSWSSPSLKLLQLWGARVWFWMGIIGWIVLHAGWKGKVKRESILSLSFLLQLTMKKLKHSWTCFQPPQAGSPESCLVWRQSCLHWRENVWLHLKLNTSHGQYNYSNSRNSAAVKDNNGSGEFVLHLFNDALHIDIVRAVEREGSIDWDQIVPVLAREPMSWVVEQSVNPWDG